MNRLKIKYAVAYGFLAATAVALIASLFAGCHVYEHEEVEIIRCPVKTMVPRPVMTVPKSVSVV